jgi:prepilin-type N-terminal cleavage/methylation domain-containing protein/prepilin-type processing-associated H-X9-DG protein
MLQRRGFTMIELLTVVAIIAILIALLLPAVQSARETARRVQCEKNLLQLGIAMGNYASTHHVFPPGVVNDKGPISNLPRGYHVGWAVQILPFIEQGNIYRRIDFRQGVYAQANQSTLSHSIYVFLCPSDSWAGQMSYMGCHHEVEAPIHADNHGMLYLNSHVAYDDIVDGPAYTILVGESVGSATLGWASGTRATLRNGGHRLNEPDPWATMWRSPSPYLHTNPDLQDPDTDTSAEQGGGLTSYYVGGFSSHHPQGVNFLFCDGSARFLKVSIDQQVLRRLANRADGEVIGDDQF